MERPLRDAVLDLIDIRQREIRHHILVTGFVLGLGTGFYMAVEGLTPLNGFYLSAITLATVGYGDVAPHTPLGRMFTTVYILTGILIHASFVQVVAARQKKEAAGAVTPEERNG